MSDNNLPHWFAEGEIDPAAITVHSLGVAQDDRNRKYAVRIPGFAMLSVTEEQWKEIEIAVRAGIIGLREFGTNAPK